AATRTHIITGMASTEDDDTRPLDAGPPGGTVGCTQIGPADVTTPTGPGRRETPSLAGARLAGRLGGRARGGLGRGLGRRRLGGGAGLRPLLRTSLHDETLLERLVDAVLDGLGGEAHDL